MAESQVLKRLDFPAYCVRVLDNGLVAIAGGGGTSKTGVGNSIELGHVELASKISGSNNHAQFQSIHTFEPQDAVMKFTSFAVDRSLPITNNLSHNAKTKSKNKSESSKDSDEIKPEFDANKSDLYIAACVNSTIEVYKVQPIIDRHSRKLTVRRTRSNSGSSSNESTTTVQPGNLRQRTTGSKKPTFTRANSKEGTIQSNNMTASASLVHQKSIHIDQIISENDNDNFLSEPEQKPKATKKLSTSLNTSKYDEETIDTVAVCQIKVRAKNNQVISNRILLCSGTSKGNICIWELVINQKRNDTNNNSKLINGNTSDMPIKCNKLKVLKDAHKQDIDDLQVNTEHSHLLSIGKDNRCIVWSLTPKIEKLCELNYTAILGDSNLRMKHARFAHNGKCLYTTYIPRIRGGGRKMSSYIHRWDVSTNNGYKVVKTHCIRNTVITSIQASKDGDCLCCGDYEGMIYLFDSNFNKLVNFKKQHSSVVTDLAFYHDSTLAYNSNKLILSLSIDRTLQCYTYLDTSNRWKDRLNLTAPTSALTSMAQFSQTALNKLNLCSINAFKIFMTLWACILLFCYFFTQFE